MPADLPYAGNVGIFVLVGLLTSLQRVFYHYSIGRPLSSVGICVCKHFRTSSPLKPLGRLKPNFIWSLHGIEERKFVQINSPDHMTKMAAMPINGKNLKKTSPQQPKDRWHWHLVCNIRCSSTNKFVQMMALGWPWPILGQVGQIGSLMRVEKKIKQWIFQKLL